MKVADQKYCMASPSSVCPSGQPKRGRSAREQPLSSSEAPASPPTRVKRRSRDPATVTRLSSFLRVQATSHTRLPTWPGARTRSTAGDAGDSTPCADSWGTCPPPATRRPGSTPSPPACSARATAAPTRAGPGRTRTWSSASTGCRSSTSTTRTSRCGGARRRTRSGTRWSSTARSTTTSNCGRSWMPSSVRPFSPTGTARRSSPASTTGAWTSSTGSAGCSPSSSGTPRPGRCSAPATRSASSRCSTPPSPAPAGSSPPRRRASGS